MSVPKLAHFCKPFFSPEAADVRLFAAIEKQIAKSCRDAHSSTCPFINDPADFHFEFVEDRLFSGLAQSRCPFGETSVGNAGECRIEARLDLADHIGVAFQVVLIAMRRRRNSTPPR
jgi:hypothetical protein